MKRPIFCPYCKSKNIVKNGFYKYKDIEKEQRYLCKNCNKLFLEKTSSPFHQMRHSANVVLFGVRLYTEFYRYSGKKAEKHTILTYLSIPIVRSPCRMCDGPRGGAGDMLW